MSNDIQKAPIKLINPILSAPEEPIDQASPFLPMVHGKATDAIARMSGSKPTPNPLNNTASIESCEVKLIIKSLDTLSGTLGGSTHKLLSTAIAGFTALNHTGTGKDRSLREAKVAIPLKEYALKCGYDVEEHPTDSTEEAAKEAKRAKAALDNFRKKVRKDLELLYNASISWKEKVKGKDTDFADIRILGGKGIKVGYINIEFTHVGPVNLDNYLIVFDIVSRQIAADSVKKWFRHVFILAVIAGLVFLSFKLFII